MALDLIVHCPLLLHPINNITTNRASFARWEDEDLARDALSTAVVSRFCDNSSVWIDPTIKAYRVFTN
jgi:hypothetical protein